MKTPFPGALRHRREMIARVETEVILTRQIAECEERLEQLRARLERCRALAPARNVKLGEQPLNEIELG